LLQFCDNAVLLGIALGHSQLIIPSSYIPNKYQIQCTFAGAAAST